VEQNAAEGGSQSLSAAATPPTNATLTPRQARAYRTMAELNEVLSPIEGEENRAFTPGVEHTLAERMGDPVTSQQETILRQQDPAKFDAILDRNHAAMVKAFQDEAGTPVSLDNLRADMERVDSENAGAVEKAIAG
jgi:hypothetical protein